MYAVNPFVNVCVIFYLIGFCVHFGQTVDFVRKMRIFALTLFATPLLVFTLILYSIQINKILKSDS